MSGYLDPLTRLGFQWVKTVSDDDLSTFGGTDRESSFVLRLDRWLGRNPALRR